MGDGNRVEMFIAICALISSAAAVFIAWDQGRVMRAQQHGEVYPVLQVEGRSSNSATYSEIGITILNSGVGPALIESVHLEIDGEQVTSLWDILSDYPTPSSDSSAGLAGRAIAPGEATEAILLRWTRDEITPNQIAQVAVDSQDWILKICYCSVFRRCWQTSRIGSGRAERVDSCPIENTDIFALFGSRGTLERSTLETAPATETEQTP